jgi:hypothetical protein
LGEKKTKTERIGISLFVRRSFIIIIIIVVLVVEE